MTVDNMGKMAARDKDAVSSHLMEDYEQTIKSLKEEIKTFWEEQRCLKAQVDDVTAENETLGRHLRDVGQVTLEPVSQDARVHQRLMEALTKEKDSAVQLWQSALKDGQRLEAALVEANSRDTEERWRRHTEQVRTQYARAVSSLSGELTRQRAVAERATSEQMRAEEAARAADAAASQLREQLQRLTRQLQELDQRCLTHTQRQLELDQQVAGCQAEAATHQEHVQRGREQAEHLQRDLLEARERCVQLSSREAEALDKLKDGVDVVQNALLEKEEAVQKASALEGDVAELEASVGRLAEEAALRTRHEVDAVRQQCNDRLATLAEKLQARDTVEVESQQHTERLMREKKQVETQYDRLKEEHSQCATRGAQCDALQEVTDRLARLEDSRDLAERAAADLTRKLHSAEARHRLEVERLTEDAADQQRRLAELADTCDGLLADKRALTEVVEAGRAEHEAAMASATERRHQLERIVSSLEQKLRQKEKRLNTEILSYETDHEHTKTELREQIGIQQKLTAKWRRDLLAATEQNEQKQSRMRNVERELAHNVTQLEDQLRDTRASELESVEEVKRYKYRVRELELRVQAAEKRFLTVHSASSRAGARRPAGFHSPGRHLED